MRVRAALGLSAALCAGIAGAAPTGQIDLALDDLLVGAVSNWTDVREVMSPELDEQIFTEVSPLIESVDAVRLPGDAKAGDSKDAEESPDTQR